MRISATYKLVNLERGLVDVAVRYCREDEAPEGAMRLFGEQELFPVCSPALLSEGPKTLRIEDLAGHALLRMDEAAGPLDWGTWLAAHGLADLKPAGHAALRQLRADDRGSAQRPGRGHGDRPPGRAA